MVAVYGKPLIGHIIATAQTARIDQIVVGIDDNKEVLKEYVSQYPVEIEHGCVEPLTGAFLRSASTRQPDVIVGVNGDTIYHPETLQQILDLLEANPDAAGAVLLSSVMRPFITSWWTYWRHNIVQGELVAMDEVPGHEIATEYIMAAFRTSALRELSDDFAEDFTSKEVPFTCHSFGWDYLTKLLLWKGQKVVGMVSDDLTLNINHPSDFQESPLFFEDPGLFRWNRMTPEGCDSPLLSERSLLLIRANQATSRVVDNARDFGLKVIRVEERNLSSTQAQDLGVQTPGGVTAIVVEAAGAFHLSHRFVKEVLKLDETVSFACAIFSRSSFERELHRQAAILDLSL
jgi:GTP:adenosylcobinamide-phosphate guanylyltransferase